MSDNLDPNKDDLFADDDPNDLEIENLDPDPVEPSESESYFDKLVGEDKKYKDPEMLAKSRLEADRFINQLKSELKGLRSELKTRVTLEKFMDQMNESRKKSDSDDGSNEPVTPAPEPAPTRDTSNKIDSEEIERLIQLNIEKKSRAQREAENVQKVKDTLRKLYGPNFSSILTEKAEELDVGRDFLSDLAKSNPKALYTLLGVNEQKVQEIVRQNTADITPPSGERPANSDRPVGQRKWRDFEAMREKDPEKYWSPQVQNEIHRQALAQGESFYD